VYISVKNGQKNHLKTLELRDSNAFLFQAEVRPRCGRVVGFGAGKENPHGVRAITKGQRCAVALWFTLDPSHEEKVMSI